MKKFIELCNRCSLLLHAAWAAVIYFIIEALSRHSVAASWAFMTGSTKVFLYNTFMIFMSFMLVYLFRRRIFARALLTAFWLYLGYMNGTVLNSRVTPFTGQDLHMITDALDVVNIYMSPVKIILTVLGVVAGIVALFLFWKFGPKYQKKINYKVNVLALLGVIALFAGTTKLALEQKILSSYFGNIAFAYEDYGFPYCFFCTVLGTGMDKPYEYSDKTIQDIITWDGATVDEDSVKPNILMLQLETFMDPTTVNFLEFSEDPIPNFHKLMKEYSSGAFTVPSVGAGTANTEFECITGMNLHYFGPGEYPYKTILKKVTCESAAYDLKEVGYTAHAVHNNKATFYSRADVFKNLGFDTFTSKEYMDISNQTANGWVKDEVLIQHILDCLDSTEGQDFVYTISVQGHGEYPTEAVLEDPAIQVSGAATEEKNYQWEYYVNQLHEMDQFVADLIAALEERGEDTILVMYGDHLPTLGLTEEDMANGDLFATSYVIWDNIGLKKKDQDLCSYQIAAEVMDQAGIHVGTMMQYHQNRMGSKWYLPDMEQLQYDLLYGKLYAYGGESPYEPTDLQYGIHQPTISNVVWSYGNLYVIGTNFTTQTRVYLDDEWKKTTYINDHVVKISKKSMTKDTLVTVKQVAPGSAKRVLSEGESYEYKIPVVEEEETEETEETEATEETGMNQEEGQE